MPVLPLAAAAMERRVTIIRMKALQTWNHQRVVSSLAVRNHLKSYKMKWNLLINHWRLKMLKKIYSKKLLLVLQREVTA